ncbi:MAG: response regulator [Proteobacteria bacterium]|nr:response regulator [Pseudomonadota bacterium]
MRNNYKNHDILFVDDELISLKYFKKLFSNDFSILTCDNVLSAKKILDDNSNNIAILLTDQRMPGEKGTDLLSYSRQYHPHIIRLLTTAYSELEDAIEAVNSGEILRYLTKPWDFNILNADLKYAMDFFLMRNERNELMKEKLNVKQRLIELNRVRDLIVMASGFTHLRNPLHAIASFLIQLPRLKQSRIANVQNLEIWGLMEKEIIEQLKITNDLITATNNDEKFDSDSFMTLIEKVHTDFNNDIELNSISLPIIKYNGELIKKMLDGIIKSLLATCSIDNKLHVSVEATSDGGKIIVHASNYNRETSSLLNTPIELLTAFFICYHHSGEITIDASDGLTYEITLPSNPESTQLAKLANGWLEEILQRFEEWPDLEAV